MRSAELPADLATIAREATRNGQHGPGAHGAHPRPRPPRAAGGRPQRRHRPRIGVDDAWIQKRTGIKSRRRALRTRRWPTTPRSRAAALQDAGVDPRDVDLVLVATMTPDDITPNAAARRGQRARRQNAGALDIGAACSGWLAALPAGRRQVETGRADRVLVIGAELLTRITTSTTEDRRAVRRRRRAVLVGAEGEGDIGPIVLAADGSLADRITATHHDRASRMDGHSTYQVAVKRLSEVTVAAVARRPRGSTTSTCSSTTRPTAGSSAPSASGSTSSPRAWPTTSPTWPTPRPPRSRSRCRCCARTGACARPEGPDRRHRRGLHLGRRRHRVGALVSRPENATTRHRRLEGHRRRDREGAGRRTAGTSRSTTAPTRRAPRRP